MNLGGLIAGALGGGAKAAGQIADTNIAQREKMDYQKQLMQMEEEKQLRIDEITRNRNIEDIGRKATADADAAPTRARGAVAGEVAGVQAALDAGLPQSKANLAATETAAGLDATLAAGIPSKKAAVRSEELDADAPNVDKAASQQGSAEGVKQVAKTGVPGFAASTASEAAAKESPSSRAANRRAQADWDREGGARKAVAEYHDAIDRGDEAGAKAARLKAIKLGVDPAGTKKGSLKVTEDEDGNKILVHEDDKGNVTRVDPQTLQPYTARNAPRGGAQYKEGDIVELKGGGRGKVVMKDGKLVVQRI